VSNIYSLSKSSVPLLRLYRQPDIMTGLLSMNFRKPSKIQEKALPMMLNNPPTNMIAQSQSGTGKTAAFVITILSRLDMTKPHSPQALCLAPSRELARQIEGVIKSIGQFMKELVIQAAVPGAVERGAPVRASVVVGTPGTVMDLIKRRQFDTREMKILCLDEADNMLDQQGLGDQCLRVKQYVTLSNFTSKTDNFVECCHLSTRSFSSQPLFQKELCNMHSNSVQMRMKSSSSVKNSPLEL
jgi:superfamily II DNA/RNA helicase